MYRSQSVIDRYIYFYLVTKSSTVECILPISAIPFLTDGEMKSRKGKHGIHSNKSATRKCQPCVYSSSYYRCLNPGGMAVEHLFNDESN